VRLVTAYTQGAEVSRNVTYLQGARQRVEFPGVVTLQQCDLGRTVLMNPEARRYRVQPHASTPAASSPAPESPDTVGSPRGGVITLTTTHTDTQERQPMFGLEARRVKTTIVTAASENACNKSAVKVEVDAWYVQLPVTTSMCALPSAAPAPAAAPDTTSCTDRIETRTAGDATLGFPVRSTTTTTTGEGDKAEVTSVSHEVTELEVARLDNALFDVPADYAQAENGAEIVPSLSTGGSLADALFGSTADGTSEAAPKRDGMIRIGVLEPVDRTDRSLPTSALRRDLVSRFTRAPYEAIPVAGSSPEAIAADALTLECDYLLLVEITQAKTSKPGRLTGAMRRVSGEAPRDRHDVELTYTLFAVGAPGSPVIRDTTKASSGGFGLGSALRLAAFAGQTYLSMYGMGGMGGMGLMNLGTMTASGGGPLGGFYDPRDAAISSTAAGLDDGAVDPAELEMRETVSEALGNTAREAAEQLKKKSRK
jgi:hypothetical protein